MNIGVHRFFWIGVSGFLGYGEGQIPYDLTFNWNIISRRKSKQNITRDIEVKNNLTITRGEWRGDYRNYYKGHMNNTKGEGGGGEGRWVHLGWGGGMGIKGIQL